MCRIPSCVQEALASKPFTLVNGAFIVFFSAFERLHSSGILKARTVPAIEQTNDFESPGQIKED